VYENIRFISRFWHLALSRLGKQHQRHGMAYMDWNGFHMTKLVWHDSKAFWHL
jgi:hypothetical protein